MPQDTAQASKEQPTQKEIRCRRLVAETANPSSRYVPLSNAEMGVSSFIWEDFGFVLGGSLRTSMMQV